MCRRYTELRRRLRLRDLVRLRSDSEEKVSLMNDVSVFEKYARKRASDLGVYLDLRDCRKLAEET